MYIGQTKEPASAAALFKNPTAVLEPIPADTGRGRVVSLSHGLLLETNNHSRSHSHLWAN